MTKDNRIDEKAFEAALEAAMNCAWKNTGPRPAIRAAIEAYEAAKQPQLNADALVDKDFAALLASARKQVKASPLYRKFIDGTPLENDIAVWMAEFAVKGGES